MTNQTPCNHRTPYKPQVEYYDDKMVIVNGVQYQRVEPPKPPTLYEMFYKEQQQFINREVICEIVERWMSRYKCDYVVCAEYLQGYNALMDTLKANLK